MKTKKIYSRPALRVLGKIARETTGSGAGSGTDSNVYAKNNGTYD